MNSDQPHKERPETFFFPETPNWAAIAETSNVGPKKRSKDFVPTPSALQTWKRRRRGPLHSDEQGSAVEVWDSDPWDRFEKGIEIFPARHVYLARDREDKARLVHIQQLAGGVAESLLENVNRHSYRSFLRLLHCYQHRDLSFMVWEPVELSLSQILGSKCSVREGEMLSIIWPILTGIRYSEWRCENRYVAIRLAELDAASVCLCKEIPAGVEHSCEIDAADMNAAAMKLVALSDIVKELRKKMSPLSPWSAAAQSVPDKLVNVSLDDLLRDDVFAQLKGGELKMLVNIASKTGHYDIRFP